MTTLKFKDVVACGDIYSVILGNPYDEYNIFKALQTFYHEDGIDIDTSDIPEWIMPLYCTCDQYHNIEKIYESKPDDSIIINIILIADKIMYMNFKSRCNIPDTVNPVNVCVSRECIQDHFQFYSEKYKYYYDKLENSKYNNYMLIKYIIKEENDVDRLFANNLDIYRVLFIPSEYKDKYNVSDEYSSYDIGYISINEIYDEKLYINQFAYFYDILVIEYNEDDIYNTRLKRTINDLLAESTHIGVLVPKRWEGYQYIIEEFTVWLDDEKDDVEHFINMAMKYLIQFTVMCDVERNSTVLIDMNSHFL